MIKVLRALAIAVVATAVVLGLAWLVGRLGHGKERAAVTFFERFYGEELMRAYQSAGTTYMSLVTMRECSRTRDFYRSLLGEYRGVSDVLEEADESDTRGHVTLELEFENGDAVGWFELEREDGTWKLRNFHLSVPRERVTQAQISDPQVFSKELMVIWAQGNATDVWQQFDFPLRERVTKAAFQVRSEAALDALGEFVAATRTSFEEPGPGRARVGHGLEFEQGTRGVLVDLVWRGSRWTVTQFEIADFD